MQIALSRIKAMGLLAILRLLREWWLEEIVKLFPARLAGWLSGPGKPVLLVAANGEKVTLELFDGTGISIAVKQNELRAVTPEFLERFISGHQIDPKDADIGLQLSENSIFSRELQLPLEAAPAIGVIAAQDLVRKTPFRL